MANKQSDLTIKNIVDFHSKMFPRANLYIQENKCLQEIAEFQTAVRNDEKIEEAVDCIISMLGFLNKMGCDAEEEILSKMEIIKKREYDYDDFDHIEKNERLVDEW